jgi:hypothetical protein
MTERETQGVPCPVPYCEGFLKENDDDNLDVDYYCDFGHEITEIWDELRDEVVGFEGYPCPVPRCRGFVKLAVDENNAFTGEEICEYGHILTG